MRNDTVILIGCGLAAVALHTATNGQYGFHRDELALIEDARWLDWGYVVYPPVTPLVARVSLTMFGTSLIGLRFFGALAMAAAMVLTGLMAGELGGKRWAQLVAAWAGAIGPVAMASGTMLQYVSIDYLWWVAIAYLTVRLLKSEDPRWWLAVGIACGLGMMTKYTMAFLVAGIGGGVLLTDVRKLRNRWLWYGAAAGILILLPNLIWQVRHHFISFEFLRFIHVRDVSRGRADGFLLAQLWKCTNIATVPLWMAGLYFLFFTREGRRYRMLGWMYAIPLALFAIARGRDYYLAAAYPMLLAAGAVWIEQWMGTLSEKGGRSVRRAAWISLALGGAAVAALVLPIAPMNSKWWRLADGASGNFNEELGWREMTEAVARVRDSLPVENGPLGILAGDAGEAGALNLYGRAYGLPAAISGSNSHWLRGYGNPPPQTVITAGFRRAGLEAIFESCEWAGRFETPFGIENTAIGDRMDIFVCRRPRQPWQVFWKRLRCFG